MDTVELSIVVPAYNEEEIIKTVIDNLQQKILLSFNSSEIIVIDDASTDRTPAYLDELSKRYDNMVVVHHPRNQGHGRSLRTGLDMARGAHVFVCDSDNQSDPEDFWKIYSVMDSSDLAIGIRTHRNDPLVRLLVSAMARLVCLALFGVRLRDPNSPFKLFRVDVLRHCLKILDPSVFAPSLMLAVIGRRLGFRVTEVPIKHFRRKTGKVSIIRWKLVKACVRVLQELLRLRRDLHRGETLAVQ